LYKYFIFESLKTSYDWFRVNKRENRALGIQELPSEPFDWYTKWRKQARIRNLAIYSWIIKSYFLSNFERKKICHQKKTSRHITQRSSFNWERILNYQCSTQNPVPCSKTSSFLQWRFNYWSQILCDGIHQRKNI